MTGLPARQAAIEALRAVGERGAYSNVAVPAAIGELEPRDRAFASHLAYDTLRWEGTLDWALGQVIDRELTGVEPELLRVLRLGALQLLRTDVPPHAVVDTGAELARRAVPVRRAKGAAGFVNGVLRALSRRVDDLPWPEALIPNLALTTAHPEWIVAELLPRLGPEETQAALTADNEPPGVTLRATGNRDALLDELREAGIDAQPGDHTPEAIRAPGADPRRLAAVREGRAVPQDEASMLVARSCAPGPRSRVLDLCAGPGGKATHLAALAGPDGHVVATELHHHRAQLVAELAARTGVRISVVTADGRRPPLRGGFDVVLVDAPCTGLGTGRRRPEVRWRRTPVDVTDLASIQESLVSSALRLVRPGGRVVYSVCTWTQRETTEVIGRLDKAEIEVVGERQLWPHRDGTDGMYLATLARR
jgi:16S rRNA (cytosine967-C5)-methyltransferase